MASFICTFYKKQRLLSSISPAVGGTGPQSSRLSTLQPRPCFRLSLARPSGESVTTKCMLADPFSPGTLFFFLKPFSCDQTVGGHSDPFSSSTGGAGAPTKTRRRAIVGISEHTALSIIAAEAARLPTSYLLPWFSDCSFGVKSHFPPHFKCTCSMTSFLHGKMVVKSEVKGYSARGYGEQIQL